MPEVLPWARYRVPSCWDRSARWRVRSSDTPQDPRSRAPGESSGPHRDLAQGMQHNRAPRPSDKQPPRQIRRHRSGRRCFRPREPRRHRFRGLNRTGLYPGHRPPQRRHLTRRANHRHILIIAGISKARAGKPAAGFFNPSFPNRTAAARHGATSSHASLPEASQAGRRPSLFLNSAGARERAGTRRGRSPRPHAASIGWRYGSRRK